MLKTSFGTGVNIHSINLYFATNLFELIRVSQDDLLFTSLSSIHKKKKNQ